eukprot:3913758-Karenia_brevis.AAC.1
MGLVPQSKRAQFKRASSINHQPMTKVYGANVSKPTNSEQPNCLRRSNRASLDKMVAKNVVSAGMGWGN